jgi:uncharacterized protein YoxC
MPNQHTKHAENLQQQAINAANRASAVQSSLHKQNMMISEIAKHGKKIDALAEQIQELARVVKEMKQAEPKTK